MKPLIYEVAIIEYQDGTIDFVPNPDETDWENAVSIIFGLSGNYTGRKPSQYEFEEAFELMK